MPGTKLNDLSDSASCWHIFMLMFVLINIDSLGPKPMLYSVINYD